MGAAAARFARAGVPWLCVAAGSVAHAGVNATPTPRNDGWRFTGPGILYTSKPHSYGVKDGGIFKSTDGGAHWMTTGLLGFVPVLPLAVDPRTSGDGTPTPTPVPTSTDGVCPAQNISVVPSSGPAGISVVVGGQCYWLHSGAGSDVYFDDVRLGSVRGDQPGNHGGVFTVPDDAAPGPHTISLARSFGGARQSTIFVVDATAPPLARGDCNRDGVVGIDELVRAVAIALGQLDVGSCPSLDVNVDGAVTIDEIVRAIARAQQTYE